MAITSTAIYSIAWPEIFITGELPKVWCKESLIAYALCAWGNCEMGARPPDKFGEGMAVISAKIGTAATPENLMALSRGIINNQ